MCFLEITVIFKYSIYSQVDIDKSLLMRNLTSVNPLVSDYIRSRAGPLKVQILQGNVADSSEELRDTDAVIAIEL